MVGSDKNKFSLQLNYCEKYCKNFCVCNIALNLSLFRVLASKSSTKYDFISKKKITLLFLFFLI